MEQVKWCEQLNSPFTARICRLFAERLSASIPSGAAILDWSGNPSSTAGGLPLRVTGALHYLARSGTAPELACRYPPHAHDDDKLWSAVERALVEHEPVIRNYLDSAPQTNEVMRSAVLLPGLLGIAELTRTDLHLYEIGASAGLNLIPDRYRYRFGNAEWGDPASPVLLNPEWRGKPPRITARLRIGSRAGVDLNPIDVRDAAARDRLLSYVWADQTERLRRLEAALSLAAKDPPVIERADAADWIERQVPLRADCDGTRVVFHSITWNYLSVAAQSRIKQHLEECGSKATPRSPFAWLRYELEPALNTATLRLVLWPTGEDRLLATAHPHGAIIEWKA